MILDVKRITLISGFCLLLVNLSSQSGMRLENEFKIAVPAHLESEVWTFIQGELVNDEPGLTTEISEEVFIDTYYDGTDLQLAGAQSGLRYRKRFVADTLNKELIQLKISDPDQDLVRGEIKYDVLKKKSVNDFERHGILKRISVDDQEDLAFNMVPYGIHPRDTDEKVKLIQIRRRVYISDGPMSSLATLTLDRVSSLKFPFHSFIEMEIELNEIRFTNAEKDERDRLQEFNDEIQSRLMNRFPELRVDQTPKYNKMLNLQNSSVLSRLYANISWLLLGLVVLVGGIKLI